ncbi:MAG: Rv3235 family protein [Dermatophilaceae bacterium]
MTTASLQVTRSREPQPPVPLPPPISLEEAVRQVRAANTPRVPRYVQDALAVDFAAASDAQMFGPQRTGRLDLPDPQRWAGRIVCALLEVMTGLRPAPQVLRWTTPEVYSVVARRGAAVARRSAAGRVPTGARTRVSVIRVRVCEPTDSVAEAAVIVRAGDRVRAVAVRLTGQDGRWQVSALHVG